MSKTKSDSPFSLTFFDEIIDEAANFVDGIFDGRAKSKEAPPGNAEPSKDATSTPGGSAPSNNGGGASPTVQTKEVANGNSSHRLTIEHVLKPIKPRKPSKPVESESDDDSDEEEGTGAGK